MAGEIIEVIRLCKVCRTEIGRFEVKQENMMLSTSKSIWCSNCRAYRNELREPGGRQESIAGEQETYPQPTPTG